MKNPIRVILKNAFANIARGVTTAMVALILPHFLTQRLTHDRFNCWSLILQIAAYASFLDFGLQIALSRFVTRAQASGQFSERDRFVSTASLLLSIAGVLSMIAICAVVWQAPALQRTARS
jgi:O-antigen/teichoic acid export membrane protein